MDSGRRGVSVRVSQTGRNSENKEGGHASQPAVAFARAIASSAVVDRYQLEKLWSTHFDVDRLWVLDLELRIIWLCLTVRFIFHLQSAALQGLAADVAFEVEEQWQRTIRQHAEFRSPRNELAVAEWFANRFMTRMRGYGNGDLDTAIDGQLSGSFFHEATTLLLRQFDTQSEDGNTESPVFMPTVACLARSGSWLLSSRTYERFLREPLSQEQLRNDLGSGKGE
jgi:hypothetical protein